MERAHFRENDTQISTQIGDKGQFKPRSFASSNPDYESFDASKHFNYYLDEIDHLSKEAIQPKLKIGPVNDKYEQEADRIAEKVMRMTTPCQQWQGEPEEGDVIRSKPIFSQATYLRQEKMGDAIQIKQACGKTSQVCPRIESSIRSLEGSGRPLAKSTRAFFEPRFGYDYSKFRVYTNSNAVELARVANARAFTVGQDIIFGAGQNEPETNVGKQLIAHELVHVIQQSSMSSKNATSNIIQRWNEEVTQSTITPEYSRGLSNEQLLRGIRVLEEQIYLEEYDNEEELETIRTNLRIFQEEAIARNLSVRQMSITEEYARGLSNEQLQDQIRFIGEQINFEEYDSEEELEAIRTNLRILQEEADTRGLEERELAEVPDTHGSGFLIHGQVIQIDYEPTEVTDDQIGQLVRTLELLEPSHLNHVPTITVGHRPAGGGGGSAHSGMPGGPYIRLNRTCFSSPWNRGNFNETLLHEIGHIVDWAYGCMQHMIGEDPDGYRALLSHPHRGRTQGRGEHFADAYAAYYLGRRMSDARRNALLNSRAWTSI